jgi:hypothetical protein
MTVRAMHLPLKPITNSSDHLDISMSVLEMSSRNEFESEDLYLRVLSRPENIELGLL